jgi:hypothetical protein
MTLPKGALLLPKPFSVSALLDAVRATLDAPAETETETGAQEV